MRRARETTGLVRGGARTALTVRTSHSGRYPVYFGRGILRRLGSDIAAGRVGIRPACVAVISDSTVARLHAGTLERSLRKLGVRSRTLTFPAGEVHKTRETKARLEDQLLDLRLGRDGLIVALGGGVTGDLAGFLAATWHRGVPLIQAPTSVIAMLDASIGGKVGVDHPRAKNLIGAFYPPIAVYADTATLGTLPVAELRSGLAEAVKCGVIADAGLFRLLERSSASLSRRDQKALVRVVLRAASVKARIVGRDERESGARMLLNFGHTLGHAFEAARAYRIRHGEAVSLGIVLESSLAADLGLISRTHVERIVRLLDALGLPTSPRGHGLNVEEVLAATRRDKKVIGTSVRYVLPAAIGRHAGGDAYAVIVQERFARKLLSAALE